MTNLRATTKNLSVAFRPALCYPQPGVPDCADSRAFHPNKSPMALFQLKAGGGAAYAVACMQRFEHILICASAHNSVLSSLSLRRLFFAMPPTSLEKKLTSSTIIKYGLVIDINNIPVKKTMLLRQEGAENVVDVTGGNWGIAQIDRKRKCLLVFTFQNSRPQDWTYKFFLDHFVFASVLPFRLAFRGSTYPI